MRGVAAILVLALPLSAADWIRLRAPGVELLTDAGERAGRKTLERLNRIRSLFDEGPVRRPVQQSNTPELRIVQFASEREFRGYTENPATDGFYQSGLDREYIVLHGTGRTPRVVAHEYIHLLLNRGTAPLPRWFEEGTAELYSTFETRGSRIVLGNPIPEHLATLREKPQLNAKEFLKAGTGSPLPYAQSWALVHMLNLAPAYRSGLPRFAELLAAGSEAETAFDQAFGRSLPQALVDLTAYVPRMRPVTVDASPAAPLNLSVSPLTETASLLARADLAMRANRTALATSLIDRAAKLRPGDPQVQTAVAMLALGRGDRDAARNLLERATATGASDASLWFEYALFERESGAPQARVHELLRKSISLNPNLAEARYLLGVQLGDSGNDEEAVEHLHAAVRVMPRQSLYWHALAYSLDKLGRRSEAAEAARRALATAATSEQEQMAKVLLDSLRSQ